MGRVNVLGLVILVLILASSRWCFGSELAYHDVDVRLVGALPNEHAKLGDELELHLGRAADGRWQRHFFGYSAMFHADSRLKPRSVYTWQDHEGEVISTREEGDRIVLEVRVTIHSDPWVSGGEGRYTISMVRDGRELNGEFSGVFVKTGKATTDGPVGERPAKGEVVGRIREQVWPARVAGHKPLQSGEHPRLLFRRSDLPSLRSRLETPEGKAIFERLKRYAGDGEEDLWDAYGYGMLYQLTGDQSWAERAAANAKAAIEDRIKAGRYGWYTRDGGYLRAGPSVAATAAAYDMCYDAWTPEFRRWVAKKIQDRIWPKMALAYDLSESDGQLSPRSNHYGNWNGAAGFAILAIKGDPGTEDEITERAHRLYQQRLKRGLEVGFGDHGWFWEGTFCGRFPTNGGFLMYLQALRVADGKDYVTPHSTARWLTAKWAFEVVRSGGRIDSHERLMYAGRFGRRTGSNSGDFAQGFGVMPEQFKPAALWFHDRVIEPDEKTYDVTGPKSAAFSMVNWPVGMAPRDPAEVFGHVLHDREAGFYVFRSGWRGEGDIVVSTWGGSAVLGRGLHVRYGGSLPMCVEPTYLQSHEDNSHSVAVTRVSPYDAGVTTTQAMAVDFSGVSGADAVLASLNVESRTKPRDTNAPKPDELPPFIRDRLPKDGDVKLTGTTKGHAGAVARYYQVVAGGNTWSLMVIGVGDPVAVQVVGEKKQVVAVGSRRLSFDGEKILLSVVE